MNFFASRMVRRGFRVLGAAAVLVLGLLALAAFWPVKDDSLTVTPRPFGDFQNARKAALAHIAANPAAVRAECRDILLDHGKRTRDVYVLLHGLTNCPAQFLDFGTQLFNRGANVYIPRTPRHGLTDRFTEELADLTAHDMVRSASEAVDIACGLGDGVVVVGLSVNAVTAAWLAQERPDISLAVVIAPFLAPAGLPGPAVAPLARLLLRAPNLFLWWDPRVKSDLPGSPFSYPRFATRTIGQTMWLGVETLEQARKSAPATGRILVVTSPTDPAISLPRVSELVRAWGGRAEHLSFPEEWDVPHDCIDPRQPDAQVERVYPQLILWMTATLP